MPRFEKSGRTKDSLYELLLIGTRIYVAEGERAKGEREWTFRERGERTFSYSDDAAAAAQYAKFVDEAVTKKKLVRAGDDTPHASAIRLRNLVVAAGRVPDGEPAALRERFATVKKLDWKHDDGRTLSITLDGVNVVVVRDGQARTLFFATLDDALTGACVEMLVARDCFGFREVT